MRVNKRWREEIIRRNKGEKTFMCLKEGSRPRIRRYIGNYPKGIASRFFKMYSGHAWLAPFLRERFGWVDSDCAGGAGRAVRRESMFSRNAWHGEMKLESCGKK